MIRIKRVYQKAKDEDGFRVLVDRMWPRGLSKEQAKLNQWSRDVAPSDGLRRWFKHDPDRWEEFRERYREELKEKHDILISMVKKAKDGDVTLLYAASDEEHNNAKVLKEFLEEWMLQFKS